MREKKAHTAVPIHELLARRWSSRAIDPERSLQHEQIIALLEAARWAPSCFGAQPWHWLVCHRLHHAEAWRAVEACLSEGNRGWAQAPLLLVATADTLFEHNQQPNRWGEYDTGAAAENLCLQSASMGLVAHQMGGFDVQRLRESLAIPERYTPMAVIAVGHQLPLSDLDAQLREREQAPRQRKELGHNIYAGEWGVPVTKFVGTAG